MTSINMSLPDAVCTFIIMSHLILYKTRNSASCICRGNQNTYFVLNKSFFRKLCHLWDSVETYETPDRPQTTAYYGAWSMHAV